MEKTNVVDVRDSDESPVQNHDGYRHGSVTNKVEVRLLT